MKPILSALLLIALVASLAACTNQPAKQTESPAPSAASEPTAAPDNTPSPQETSEPEPTSPQEAAVYAPMDIFSSEFNPYGDMEHPDIFTVFAAYFPAIDKYNGHYPDVDTVTQMFNDAFRTQGKDFYDKPIAHFEQLVRELFGMSVEELYALPKK